MKPQRIADCRCACGENPLWHTGENKFYWVDIPPGRLFAYDPADDSWGLVYEAGSAIGGFTFQADGSLLLFGAGGAVQVWRDGAVRETVLESVGAEVGGRFNDVIADPLGGVFCGTMPIAEQLGRLYYLSPAGTLRQLLDGIGCSNGLGFTPDRTGLYYTDTPTGHIYRFDYDAATGEISNQRIWATAADAPGEGKPDGLTVDADGCVWSARWGGGCVVRYSPDGDEIGRVDLPTSNVTAVAFGGENLRDLYITTAGGKPDADPAAGALYRLRPGAAGLAEFRSNVSL